MTTAADASISLLLPSAALISRTALALTRLFTLLVEVLVLLVVVVGAANTEPSSNSLANHLLYNR